MYIPIAVLVGILCYILGFISPIIITIYINKRYGDKK